jgi:hypothetical protein
MISRTALIVCAGLCAALLSLPASASAQCGDAYCDPSIGEDEWSCPDDCGYSGYCGDSSCDSDVGEDQYSCPDDCGSPYYCGDSSCDSDQGEDEWSCPDDCGYPGYCGDLYCSSDEGEDEWSCPDDCGSSGYCGDGSCDAELGEDEWSCPDDCGYSGYCGDGYCEFELGEDEWSCPDDCGYSGYCGDGSCDSELGEDEYSCPDDCGEPGYCGDGYCEAELGEDEETCPDDCAVDADGDGYYSDEDCDDNNASVNPGMYETCNGIDDDCNDLIDDEDDGPILIGVGLYFFDADGDGYGDPWIEEGFCDPPDGYVTNDEDCDDCNELVYPGAPELCDGIDNDCDGEIDEDSEEAQTWYYDGDGDGYGDEPYYACEQEEGYVSQDGDCDDSDATIHPGASEYCDEIDNDCDDLVDEDDPDVVDATRYYWDADDDSYGVDQGSELFCDPPAEPEWVTQGGDCDDSKSYIFPGAQEYCDPLDEDEDCDGAAEDDDPDSLLKSPFWWDGDGDGYGDANDPFPVLRCDPDGIRVGNNDDCDDGAPDINPDAAEVCDPADTDENCNGVADSDDPTLVDGTDYYADIDGDAYGDPNNIDNACELPPGHVTDNQDCNDLVAAVHPGATELCDGIDNDCDQLVDDDDPGVADQTWWAEDADGDGFPNHMTAEKSCEPTPPRDFDIGMAPHDCNDYWPQVHPGAPELCDGVDQDCDLYVDEDFDLDGDGWATCFGDCDDGDDRVHPAGVEVCNARDDDCDGDLALEACLGACGDGVPDLELAEPLPACVGGPLVLSGVEDLSGGLSVDVSVVLAGAVDLGGVDVAIETPCDIDIDGALVGDTVVLVAGGALSVSGELDATSVVLRAGLDATVTSTGWVLAETVEIEAPLITLAGDVDSQVDGCSEGGTVLMTGSSTWLGGGDLLLDGDDVAVRGLVSDVDSVTLWATQDATVYGVGEILECGGLDVVAGGQFSLRGDLAGLGWATVSADSFHFRANGSIDQVGEVDIALDGTVKTVWAGDVSNTDFVTANATSLRLNRKASFVGNGQVSLFNAAWMAIAADFVDNDAVSIVTGTFALNRRASFVGNAACTVAGTQTNNRNLVGCVHIP